MSFQVHRDEFVQIINVRNSHWCIVSNIGCGGVVNVYDSLYPSVSKSTLKLTASLVFSPASKPSSENDTLGSSVMDLTAVSLL